MESGSLWSVAKPLDLADGTQVWPVHVPDGQTKAWSREVVCSVSGVGRLSPDPGLPLVGRARASA